MKETSKTVVEYNDMEKKQIRKKLIITIVISAVCFVMLFLIQLFEFINNRFFFCITIYAVLLIGLYCFVSSVIYSMQLDRKYCKKDNTKLWIKVLIGVVIILALTIIDTVWGIGLFG